MEYSEKYQMNPEQKDNLDKSGIDERREEHQYVENEYELTARPHVAKPMKTYLETWKSEVSIMFFILIFNYI